MEKKKTIVEIQKKIEKLVIILGAGTSIKEGIEKGLWDKIRKYETWSLNSMYKIMPYLPTKELWADRKFFDMNITELQIMCQRDKVELITKKNSRYNLIPEIIQRVSTTKVENYAKEKDTLYTGRMGLVGLFALSLAVKENYDKIYLLGYDWGTTSLKDTNTHVYQDKIKQLKIYSGGAGRPIVYFRPNGKLKDEINDFKTFNKDREKIINVSIKSNINFFQKIDYLEFFKRIKEDKKYD